MPLHRPALLLLSVSLVACVDGGKTDTDTAAPGDFKVEMTEIGKETVDGHPCVKNKVVVTDKENKKHESTVWNATDLKNFPIKIQTQEQGGNATMLFVFGL